MSTGNFPESLNQAILPLLLLVVVVVIILLFLPGRCLSRELGRRSAIRSVCHMHMPYIYIYYSNDNVYIYIYTQ